MFTVLTVTIKKVLNITSIYTNKIIYLPMHEFFEARFLLINFENHCFSNSKIGFEPESFI